MNSRYFPNCLSPRSYCVLLFAIPLLLAGCASTQRRDHAADERGVVFYVDGAGGGSVLTDWGRGVQEGLAQAKYPGDFHAYHWQTGLGIAADQAAGVDYKRGKARGLAREIEEYQRAHPERPIDVVSLSAGTTITVFALEDLPETPGVRRVVLLGSSLSSHYDVSKALARVRERMTVFTSTNDVVLGALVPIAGTADREYCGACAVGLAGLHLPAGADENKRRLYAKIDNIDWRPEFAAAGNAGGHTDSVNPRFIRTYVAPLLEADGPRFMQLTDALVQAKEPANN